MRKYLNAYQYLSDLGSIILQYTFGSYIYSNSHVYQIVMLVLAIEHIYNGIYHIA